jgi:ComF family protein
MICPHIPPGQFFFFPAHHYLDCRPFPRKMLRNLLDLIFPRTCPGCEQVLVRSEGAVCTECLLAVQETNFHHSEQENELYYRLAGKTPLQGAFAMYYFDKRGRFQKVIKALKYKNMPQVGRFLGEMYGEMLQENGVLSDVDAIIPVPLHRTRLRERGYNQSEQIARGLSKATGIPVDNKSMARREKTATQTRKSQAERWENVKDVFAIRSPLRGHLLLVDDVITTGATLESCIRTLYDQAEPPESVRVAALGMARHE